MSKDKQHARRSLDGLSFICDATRHYHKMTFSQTHRRKPTAEPITLMLFYVIFCYVVLCYVMLCYVLFCVMLHVNQSWVSYDVLDCAFI